MYPNDPALALPYDLVQRKPQEVQDFSLNNGILRRKGKICVPHGTPRNLLLYEFHDTPYAGHKGISKTYKALKALYWWAGMKKDITNYITNCPSCLQNKRNRQSPEGLLQPLPIPLRTWEHITMDFLTKLPETSQGHTAVLVVVCRFSKRAHFLATQDNDDAVATVRTFLDNIFKLHAASHRIKTDASSLHFGKNYVDYWEQNYACPSPNILKPTVNLNALSKLLKNIYDPSYPIIKKTKTRNCP
jgi:hypothetical protein